MAQDIAICESCQIIYENCTSSQPLWCLRCSNKLKFIQIFQTYYLINQGFTTVNYPKAIFNLSWANYSAPRRFIICDNPCIAWEIDREFILDSSRLDYFGSDVVIKDLHEWQIENMSKIYDIRILSPFVLTPKQVKDKLGIGNKVLSVELEKDAILPEITDTDSAVEAIIATGYRALARAYHPDLGGSTEVMAILNRTKRELKELLESTKDE